MNRVYAVEPPRALSRALAGDVSGTPCLNGSLALSIARFGAAVCAARGTSAARTVALLHQPARRRRGGQDATGVSRNQETRRARAKRLDGGRGLRERRANHALVGARGALHDGHRKRGVPVLGAHELRNELHDAVERHEEHGGAQQHELRKVGHHAAAAGAGADEHLVGHVAVGGRNVGRHRRRERRGDAGNHRGHVAVAREERVLLAAAAEDVGVALLEPHHLEAAAEAVEADVEKLLLRGLGVAGEFARDEHAGGFFGDQVEHLLRHELVGV